MDTDAPAVIEVQDLGLGYADHPVMHGLGFRVNKGDIFIVMGMNGCGKSTLLKSLIGLQPPTSGKILYDGRSFWDADEAGQKNIMRRFGVLYQGGALWSSMTIGENIALPLQVYTALSPREIAAVVARKLALVGLEGDEDSMPSGLSGGMRKRASLARAIALDPDIIFFDEPSAGLDPVNARKLDDLFHHLRESTGATFVVITHELASIFAIGNNSVFLDLDSKTMIAGGDPRVLLSDSKDQRVVRFLTRQSAAKELSI